MLSSVAKPPPAVTQAGAPPKVIPADPAQAVPHPPPLPPAQVTPVSPQSQGRLSAITHVKLPPKTSSVPRLASLSGTPLVAPGDKAFSSGKATPPPLPAKGSEPKKSGAQYIPPIKLNPLSSGESSSGESIFPQADQPGASPAPKPGPKPAAWKSFEAGELHPPAGGLQSLEAFERSRPVLDKPAPETPLPEAKAPPLVAPPLLPPVRVETPVSAAKAIQSLRPPPLPPEKLPPPHLPADVRKSQTDSTESPGVHKVPALIQPEASSSGHPPQAPSAKPALLPPTSPVAKAPGNWMKATAPLVVSSSAHKVEASKIVEAKPALKPAVFPKRSLSGSLEAGIEAPQPSVETPKATDTAAPAAQSSAPETAMPSSWEKKQTGAKVSSAQPPPAVSLPPKAKAPLPPTRAERAKKRRFYEIVAFYGLLVATGLVLFFGSFYFGRDTRVEGQIIPPAGMTLNNEVWIVTDFWSLATGISDDLAKDRIPLMQEIQVRQDHVQRVQADVASREERIRLIQQDIEASKNEIDSVIKQSRDDTQKIWDGVGAQIDAEYQSRVNQLKQVISDRAKSLKLNYQPDDNFPSPEVWANAYRLALYEVPAGVDSVKEHQWLGDQMKQWRDFLKTLDDRKEQLREQAAQIKLAPGPKIADLNTKIDDLQQRVDATTAEEAPLKAELQQAQADLAASQADEAGLDDKYYKQLDPLPEEAITKHISLATNGRFTWVDDDVFAEGEKEHRYWIFTRATRADGRQYWALGPFSIEKNHLRCLLIEPDSFISTKTILRPDLSPEEQAQ